MSLKKKKGSIDGQALYYSPCFSRETELQDNCETVERSLNENQEAGRIFDSAANHFLISSTFHPGLASLRKPGKRPRRRQEGCEQKVGFSGYLVVRLSSLGHELPAALSPRIKCRKVLCPLKSHC